MALSLPLRVQAPPAWGIEPVPQRLRVLGALDQGALWGSLGVSLLLMVAGSLLVVLYEFSLSQALVAILIGAVIGNLLLGLAAVIGAENGVPSMVALRAPLGIRGSYLPTALNVLQNIGWGTFEITIMALAADQISQALWRVSAPVLWVVVFALISIGFALGGPLVVVRQWIEKFAIWLVLATTIYLTWYLLTRAPLGELWTRGGTTNFWLGVDLVVAMPVSWFPLVADYSRFGRSGASAFWGTSIGYLVSNVWFYLLGVLFVLALGTQDVLAAFPTLTAGWLLLLILLVDETDEGFANIYSTSVSLQNYFPKASQRGLILLVGAVCAFLAILIITQGIPLLAYESFLLLIGSFFVPLLGVVLADYFLVRRRRYEVDALYRTGSPFWFEGGFHWRAIVIWAVGVALYWLVTDLPQKTLANVHITLPELATRLPLLSGLATFGGTIPSFLVAFVLYWLIVRPRAASTALEQSTEQR
jgi:NCS1 family nucleobase:cation symporter-1